MTTPLVYLLLLIIGLAIGPAEYYGLSNMKYSKFRAENGISSRLGMFILYFVPLLVYLGGMWWYFPTITTTQWLFTGAYVGHFAKRCLESLFLHKYSGPIDVMTVGQIAAFYSMMAVMAVVANASTPAGFTPLLALGLLLYLMGEAGNFYHHWLLAQLRQNSTGYVIPQGGLFTYVSCPHYLFELIAWLGLVCIAPHPLMFIALITMISYLTGRSLRAQQWYYEKFPNYPPHRKAIFPFLV